MRSIFLRRVAFSPAAAISLTKTKAGTIVKNTAQPRIRSSHSQSSATPTTPAKGTLDVGGLFFFHDGFDSDLAAAFAPSFTVRQDFVTPEEEENLAKEVEPHLSRQVYEKDHWDDVRMSLLSPMLPLH